MQLVNSIDIPFRVDQGFKIGFMQTPYSKYEFAVMLATCKKPPIRNGENNIVPFLIFPDRFQHGDIEIDEDTPVIFDEDYLSMMHLTKDRIVQGFSFKGGTTLYFDPCRSGNIFRAILGAKQTIENKTYRKGDILRFHVESAELPSMTPRRKLRIVR